MVNGRSSPCSLSRCSADESAGKKDEEDGAPNMPRAVRVAIGVPRLSALLALMLVSVGCTGEESPGDKREWSILQSLEYTTRGHITTSPQFQVIDGYELMGAPREGDGHIVWIMLKPTHGSLYKQMPDGSFHLDEKLWSKLSSEQRMSTTVSNALRGHLADPKP
jgi:hypothetical protein